MKWLFNKFQQHPLIATIIILVIFYILYKIISGYIAKYQAAKNYKKAVDQSQTALQQAAAQGIVPSYSQVEYTTMSNALQNTFSGCGMDWDGIVIPTFQRLKNNADAYALIQAYDVRNINECGWGSFNGDLAATLGYKTSGITATFNTQTPVSLSSINSVLNQNGLTFHF